MRHIWQQNGSNSCLGAPLVSCEGTAMYCTHRFWDRGHSPPRMLRVTRRMPNRSFAFRAIDRVAPDALLLIQFHANVWISERSPRYWFLFHREGPLVFSFRVWEFNKCERERESNEKVSSQWTACPYIRVASYAHAAEVNSLEELWGGPSHPLSLRAGLTRVRLPSTFGHKTNVLQHLRSESRNAQNRSTSTSIWEERSATRRARNSSRMSLDMSSVWTRNIRRSPYCVF